jgi:hypothetical protein
MSEFTASHPELQMFVREHTSMAIGLDRCCEKPSSVTFVIIWHGLVFWPAGTMPGILYAKHFGTLRGTSQDSSPGNLISLESDWNVV